MPKKAGIAIVTLGAVLILSALLLLLYNRREDAAAGQEAELLLEEVRESIAAPEEAEDEPLEYEYAGILRIPALGRELPVISQWSYPLLKLAPCRQMGSAAEGDLVIAAHNYDSHFGRLKELQAGDAVSFTDMEGTVYEYTVAEVQQLSPEDAEDVTFAFNSGYPLVLYTCTPGGKARVAAFCDSVTAQ